MTDNTQPFVRFKAVKKSYNGKDFVVKNFNLDIAHGEFITMLGPSGSGKTTCLMMLAGFETVTGGEIHVAGKVIQSVAPHKRNIGMVFQNYALFPHMTVAQNLAYPLKFRNFNQNKIKKQVDKYLELVELEDFSKRYPKELSGGQKQRVALARALIYEPKLVLMDEPLGALDKNLREQMQYEIKRLHKLLGFTVVYVTHDQTEALTMSDRIAVFDNGVIQQISDASTLYEQPENKFVAEFIGENNHIVGTINNKIGDGDEVEILVGEDEVIIALAVDLPEHSNSIYLSIRPEKIIINPKQQNINCQNIFDGVISDIIYVGDHLRISVCFLASKAQFVTKQPSTAFFKNFKKDQHIDIGWFAKDCRALSENDDKR